MKKQRLKNLLKTGILSTGVFIFLWTCQKDEAHEHKHESVENSTSQFSRVSINDLIKTDNTFSQLSKNFIPTTTLSNKNSSDKSSSNDLIITSDTINVIEKENYKSYTIRIKRRGYEFDTENLIIEHNNGVENAYILSYDFKNDWVVNYLNGIHTAPEATVYYSKFNTSNLSAKTSTSKSSSISCQNITITVTLPCGQGHYYRPPCKGSLTGNLYPTNYSITQQFCNGDGGGSETDFGSPLTTNDDGFGGSGSGGSPSPSDSNDISQTQSNLEDMAEFVEFKLNALISRLELNTEQAKWVADNNEKSLDIYDFVAKENSWSNNAKEFAKLAVEALTDGGEVDFDDNIIYDNSLNNLPCQKLVIEEAIGTCSPLTQLILDIFEANDGTNLIFKSSSTLSNVNANTSSTSSYNATTHTCDITITFRESYLQTATDLAIARTAIHESLHATLVYMFEENLLQSANGTPMNGFEDFVEAYINHLSGLNVNLNKAHHELMADFIEDIASSLSVYGASNGHSNSFNFYKKLSWSGDILKTPTYQSLYPEYLNPLDATTNPSNVNPAHLDIVNTNAAEENDVTYDYDHPNGTTYTHSPKGTAPNATEPCN